MTAPQWHHLNPADTPAAQQAASTGLGADEASRRPTKHGTYRLTPPPKRGRDALMDENKESGRRRILQLVPDGEPA